MIAQKIGQETLLPSLQLALEDPGANSSNCGEGYSCAYTNSISWTSPTQPLPMELESAGGVRAPVRRRRHARRARRAPRAGPQHSRFGHAEAWRASRRICAPATARGSTNTRRHPRDRAAAGPRQESRPARPTPTASWFPPACRNPSTSTSSCSSTCRRWRSRPTSRAFRRVLYARDLTAPRLSGERRRQSASTARRTTPRIRRASSLFEDQPVSREVPGVLRGQAEEHAGRRRHAAGSFADALRHQHGRFQPAPALRRAAHSGGRRVRASSRADGIWRIRPRPSPPGNLLLSILEMYGIHQDSIGDSTGRLDRSGLIGDHGRDMRVRYSIAVGARRWCWCSRGVRRRRQPGGRCGDEGRHGGRAALLIEQKADVNAPQADGATAIQWAAYRNDLETGGRADRGRREREGRQPRWRHAAVPGLHQRQRAHDREAAEGRRGSERGRSARRNAADARVAQRQSWTRSRCCSITRPT